MTGVQTCALPIFGAAVNGDDAVVAMESLAFALVGQTEAVGKCHFYSFLYVVHFLQNKTNYQQVIRTAAAGPLPHVPLAPVPCFAAAVPVP